MWWSAETDLTGMEQKEEEDKTIADYLRASKPWRGILPHSTHASVHGGRFFSCLGISVARHSRPDISVACEGVHSPADVGATKIVLLHLRPGLCPVRDTAGFTITATKPAVIMRPQTEQCEHRYENAYNDGQYHEYERISAAVPRMLGHFRPSRNGHPILIRLNSEDENVQ